MPVCSVFRRIQSRRGGGGVERGGDACIAQPGKRAPTRGDASIPTPLHTAPAPTRWTKIHIEVVQCLIIAIDKGVKIHANTDKNATIRRIRGGGNGRKLAEK